MTYQEGINDMKSLIGKSGKKNVYDDIFINYPGENRPGDYRLTIGDNAAPTHTYIARLLYDLIINKHYTYMDLKILLGDVYTNGTNTAYADPDREYLKHLVYWITLQEEINYPRKNGCAGINLPFCRYFEAIYATEETCIFTIDEVISRCNNHNKGRPILYKIPDAPNYYNYSYRG